MEQNIDDDIDFSIIGPGEEKPKPVDFSVSELLSDSIVGEPQEKTERNSSNNRIMADVEGSFLRDLGKMEEEISYETEPYDIYNLSDQLLDCSANLSGKQQETCTKTTNQIVRPCERLTENEFPHLIIDFTAPSKPLSVNIKKMFSEYFEASFIIDDQMKLRRGSKSPIVRPFSDQNLQEKGARAKYNILPPMTLKIISPAKSKQKSSSLEGKVNRKKRDSNEEGRVVMRAQKLQKKAHRRMDSIDLPEERKKESVVYFSHFLSCNTIAHKKDPAQKPKCRKNEVLNWFSHQN